MEWHDDSARPAKRISMIAFTPASGMSQADETRSDVRHRTIVINLETNRPDKTVNACPFGGMTSFLHRSSVVKVTELTVVRNAVDGMVSPAVESGRRRAAICGDGFAP